MSAYSRKTATLECVECCRKVSAHTTRGGKHWAISRLDDPKGARRLPVDKPEWTCGDCEARIIRQYQETGWEAAIDESW